MRRVTFIVVLVTLGLVAVLFFGYLSVTNSNNTYDNQGTSKPSLFESRSISLSFSFGDNSSVKREIPTQGGTSLLELINRSNLQIETENFPPLGKMITSINGFKNGTDGKYWQYWINGEYAQIGASAYIPKPGDRIEWRFTSGKP